MSNKPTPGSGEFKLTSKRERVKEYLANRYKYAKENNLCRRCLSPDVLEGRRSCATCLEKDRLYSKNKGKINKNKVRDEVFRAYGNCCSCCGESEPLFLEIDHIYNDGAEWRRENKNMRGLHLYYWLRQNKFPPDFQILCSNCNMGKYRNGGVCPHVLEINNA